MNTEDVIEIFKTSLVNGDVNNAYKIEVLTSPLPDESLEEFIESYARTDEIMPEDKTIGFVIINKEKKVASLNFSEKYFDQKKLDEILEKYKNMGYKTEVEYS